ncbi:MAG: translation initiation factor IF-2, partial [Clostridia bacterium]|nr:translation initiation factor IF-2 [Clostridia bacterium]
DKTAEEALEEFHVEDDESSEKMVSRPPIVTVMGHVDHGKTSLLDAIRKTSVVAGEAGGITQHIGAYTVTAKGKQITFIDTPGHEAFTAMRARGASVTDVCILVVAADDGIMPQTVEAINHAKAANVPMVVAINKMDKPEANPDRILQQLTEHDVLAEDWGGDTIVVPVSAKKREGLDKLLEMVLLVAEMKELKANPDRKAKGTIIEAKLDKGKGPMASVLVQNGTLRVGDTVIAGTASGRIRAMLDDKGRNVKEAGPSFAVSVLGFGEVPNAGDSMFALDDEKMLKSVLEERTNKLKEQRNQATAKVTLDDVFSRISEGQIKTLNLIVKADVQGSVEAVKQALLKLGNDEVKVAVIHGAVGGINESDVMLASTASAIIIGFNVRPEAKAKALAEHDGVDIKLYRVIYEAIEDVSNALKGMLAPKYKETITGEAEVRNTFRITGVGTVAGCYVTSGKMVRGSKLRLFRDNVVIYDGEMHSLKRMKDDVKEVAQGYECGIAFESYNDIKEGDVIEGYIIEQI